MLRRLQGTSCGWRGAGPREGGDRLKSSGRFCGLFIRAHLSELLRDVLCQQSR